MPIVEAREGIMTEPADEDEPCHEAEEMQRMIVRTTGAGRLLSAAYVLELRRLIQDDAYRTVHIADEIARRMLLHGDV